MWEAGRMGLVFVGTSALLNYHMRGERGTDELGPDAGDSIRSVLQTGSEVYATAGKRLIKYFRGKEVGEFQAPDGSELGTMILLGEDIMVLKEDGSGLLIWNIKTGGMPILL